MALPDTWIQAAAARGVTLKTTADLTPQMLQDFTEMLLPILLEVLTPENLRGSAPEVVARLPAGCIETLAAGLRAELDERARPAGGLGALAAKAEAEAAAPAADAPPSGGARLQQVEGTTTGLTLETAADLMTSGYAASAAELLNLLVANMAQAPQLMADLTPDVVAWLVEQEQGFLENLSPPALRLLWPEVLTSLPESFCAGLDPDLRADLQGIAAGTATAFIRESTIATVNGNPGLLLTLCKDGEANRVSTSDALYDETKALKAAYPGVGFEATFEQASFVKESISGVTREGASVVIGGLLTSTLLTLVVVPVIYSLLDRFAAGRKTPSSAPPG